MILLAVRLFLNGVGKTTHQVYAGLVRFWGTILLTI